MDHGLQHQYLGADDRAECDSERQRRSDLGIRCRNGSRWHWELILLDANGVFDSILNSSGFPAQGDYGNAFMRLTTRAGLAVANYFEMDNESQENSSDTDLGSGGTLLLNQTDSTGKTWNLAVGAGKDSNLYVVDRTNMGKFSSTRNNIYQELSGALPGGVWAMPAAFNGNIYYGPVGSPLLRFQFKNAKVLTAAVAKSTNSFGYPGTTPSISASAGKRERDCVGRREYQSSRVARL